MSTLIEYKNVELHRKELLVLRDVSFTVSKGEFAYLTGKVGSGKSTLLKSIYADVGIAGGDATVMGYDLRRIKPKQVPYLRRRIGFVFQDYQLLTDRNVHANLDFVLRATDWHSRADRDIRIDEVLDIVGMRTKSYKMPYELSGGEQQRIVIARALLNRPDIILADEPTGNLDPETGDQIIGHLSDISIDGTAVLIATHDMRIIDNFPGRQMRCEDKALVL